MNFYARLFLLLASSSFLHSLGLKFQWHTALNTRWLIIMLLGIGTTLVSGCSNVSTTENGSQDAASAQVTNDKPPNLDAGPLESLRENMEGTYAAQIKCKTCDKFELIELQLKKDKSFAFKQDEPTNLSFYGQWTITSDTSLVLYVGAEEVGRIDWASDGFRYIRLQELKDAYFPPGQRLVRKEAIQLATPQTGIIGMYLYFADVGLLTTCDTDKTYIVQLTPKTIELEREYLKRGKGPEFKLLVALQGDVEVRQRAEGKGKEEVLIVDKIIQIYPDLDCESLTQ